MKEFEIFYDIEELDNESKYLVHKAKEAANFAYAPYSKFHVGAAIMLEDGTVLTGSNQENASYPLCICAERVVLYTAATQHPEKQIMKMDESFFYCFISSTNIESGQTVSRYWY